MRETPKDNKDRKAGPLSEPTLVSVQRLGCAGTAQRHPHGQAGASSVPSLHIALGTQDHRRQRLKEPLRDWAAEDQPGGPRRSSRPQRGGGATVGVSPSWQCPETSTTPLWSKEPEMAEATVATVARMGE